jgi:transposase
LEERVLDTFENVEAAASESPVDRKVLHAKIGQLLLENDCLEGALSNVALLSVRRD